MTLYLYNLVVDPRTVDKSGAGAINPVNFSNLELGYKAIGNLRDRCSIIDPVFTLELDNGDVGKFNYLYAVEWGRYYFVRETVVERTGLVTAYCHVDVLYTYKTTILNLSAYVERNETNAKPFLPDGRRVISRDVTKTIVTPDNMHKGIFDVSPVSATSIPDPTIILNVVNPSLGGLVRPYAVDLTHPTSDWAVDSDPNFTSGCLTSFLYAVSADQLGTFYAYLNAKDFGTGSNSAIERLLVGHGIDGVIDVIAYPFRLATVGGVPYSPYHIVKDPGTTKHIFMYGEDTGCDGYITFQNCNPIIDFGTFKYKNSAVSFLDYEPYTKCQMYLPYVGIVDLPMEIMANGGVDLSYFIEMGTGKCQAILKSHNDACYIKTLSGQIGVNVPLMGSNANETLKKWFGNLTQITAGGLQMAQGIIAMNPGSVIGGVMTAGKGLLDQKINNQYIMSSTSLDSALGRALHCDPYLLITSSIDETPANYGHFVGYPLESVVTLSTLSGFTIVGEVFGHIANEMEDEHDEIMRLLKSGVIL